MISILHDIGMTDAMITSSFITIFICIAAILVSRRISVERPEGIQNMVEMGIEKLHNFFVGLMGEEMCRKYFPLVGTLFIYILICNYSGLLPFAGKAPGFQAPTSDINFPAGLALMVIILVQIIGLREHRGMGTYKRMIQPFVFIFPLMLMDELAKPISLTFRLYGNTYGDEMVVDVLRDLCPFLLPVVMQLLVILLALIQAIVFALLTAIYIGEAVEKENNLPIEQHI